MIINISKFDNDDYLFALKYLQQHGKQQHRWDPRYTIFSSELFKRQHDDEDFNIDPDVFDWNHLMIAERYVEKHERKFDANKILMYSELGPNPFKRRKMSNGGSKTKRRGRHRVRTHRRRA